MTTALPITIGGGSTAMKTREYRVSFTTPAFLGNAEQQGQWRTPPFKALIRQWWRVAYAASNKFEVNVGKLRCDEGQLFGVAGDREGNSSKSRIRVRLSQWDLGKLSSWGGYDAAQIAHPEVKKSIGAHLYLGYGPLDSGQGGTVLKRNAAIQAGEQAALMLAYPNEDAPLLETALWLMQQYGTLGGRSRNGWGSFMLTPQHETPPLSGSLEGLKRDWRDAMDFDWPHAIATDDQGPLIWQTREYDDWKPLMRELAEIKIGLRTQFIFNSGRDASAPEDRHWLSYPVTRHNVKAWREQGRGDYRLPNSLRFKVRAETNGRVRGVIFHIPCLPPSKFSPDRQAVENVWKNVHCLLGEVTKSVPQRRYRIPDPQRLAFLKPILDRLTIERIDC